MTIKELASQLQKFINEGYGDLDVRVESNTFGETYCNAVKVIPVKADSILSSDGKAFIAIES